MSAYSTKEITRQEAEDMVRRCRIADRPADDDISSMSEEELDEELHNYVYREEDKFKDIVGFLDNYIIVDSNQKQ